MRMKKNQAMIRLLKPPENLTFGVSRSPIQCMGDKHISPLNSSWLWPIRLSPLHRSWSASALYLHWTEIRQTKQHVAMLLLTQWCCWWGCGWVWRRIRWSPWLQTRSLWPWRFFGILGTGKTRIWIVFSHANIASLKAEASLAVYSKSGEWYLTFSIWLGASFDEPNGILDELPAGLNELRYLIHGVWAVGTDQKQITLAASSAGHRSLLCWRWLPQAETWLLTERKKVLKLNRLSFTLLERNGLLNFLTYNKYFFKCWLDFHVS